jgi:glycosyltransferase involved in cell wall biosynthesis
MEELSGNFDLLSSNILIVGLARNCEKTIREDILTIRNAVIHCPAVQWLIVESDSSDRTVDVLSKLKDEVSEFRSVSLGSLRKQFPLRTARIAHCRNVYLAELRENPIYANVDYVVVADLDGVNRELTESSLLSCKNESLWDVCAANQRGPYYDIWALRHKNWCPTDCWQQYRFLIEHGVRRRSALRAAVYSKMITVAEDGSWIEVDSAFGGLAVYRRAVLRDVEYAGLTDAGDEICEHVELHKQITARGGRIFINPRLINARDVEHSRNRHLVFRLRRHYSNLQNRVSKLFAD